MRRIRLAFFIGSLNLGGSERNVLHLCSALDRRRYDIEVWCTYAGQPLQRDIERLGVPCRALKEPSLGKAAWARLLRYNLPFQRRLAALMRRFRPDLLHVFGFPAAYYGVLLGRLSGVRRIIFTVQDWDVWKRSPVYRLLDALCSRLASRVIADGRGAGRLAVRAQSMASGKITVIYDGVNPAELVAARPRADVLGELGLDPARPVAGVIARLDVRKKGQDVLLEAIPLVAAKAPTLQYLLVGGGPDEAELRVAAERLPASCRPRFAGFRSDLGELLNALDIVVIPSRWESVPKVLLEAMWCRRAVVATRVGDVGEILDDRCGVLVEPDSREELARALTRLALDPALRRRLGEAAHGRIAAMGLTLEQSARRYDAIYGALLHRSAGVDSPRQ